MTVLGAAARLGRQDPLDFDGVAAPRQPHLVGECGEGRDLIVGHRGERGQLVEIQEAALVDEGSTGGLQQGSGHGRTVVAACRTGPN